MVEDLRAFVGHRQQDSRHPVPAEKCSDQFGLERPQVQPVGDAASRADLLRPAFDRKHSAVGNGVRDGHQVPVGTDVLLEPCGRLGRSEKDDQGLGSEQFPGQRNGVLEFFGFVLESQQHDIIGRGFLDGEMLDEPLGAVVGNLVLRRVEFLETGSGSFGRVLSREGDSPGPPDRFQ